MQYSIYALIDSETNKPFYVGKAKSFRHRFSQHISDAECLRFKNRKDLFVNAQMKKGFYPEAEILEVCDERNGKIKEQQWIYRLSQWGFELYNSHYSGGKPMDRKRWKQPIPLSDFEAAEIRRLYKKGDWIDVAAKSGYSEASAKMAVKRRSVYEPLYNALSEMYGLNKQVKAA